MIKIDLNHNKSDFFDLKQKNHDFFATLHIMTMHTFGYCVAIGQCCLYVWVL